MDPPLWLLFSWFYGHIKALLPGLAGHILGGLLAHCTHVHDCWQAHLHEPNCYLFEQFLSFGG